MSSDHSYERSAHQPDPREMSAGPRAVFEYWEQLRGERPMPAWQEFEWMALPANVIPWCAVVDISETPLDFIYRFWGTARSNLQGQEYTGVSVRDVKPRNLADKIFDEYSQVWKNKKPVYFVTTEPTDGKRGVLEYHFLRIPFGDATQSVTQILSIGMYEETDIKVIQKFFQPDA